MVSTHMFWAQGDLGPRERLCVASFLHHGFDLTLWTYGQITGGPSALVVRDARELLPESSLFLNRQGSFAGFSDLFRYSVLRRFGGLYADTDVIALKSARSLPTQPFLVTERTQQGGLKINGNVIHNPHPAPGNLIDLAHAYAERFPKHEIIWSEIGPTLLTALVGLHPRHGFALKEPDFANALDWWRCPQAALQASDSPSAKAHFLHLYNEQWRRAGVAADAPFPAGSLLARLARQWP